VRVSCTGSTAFTVSADLLKLTPGGGGGAQTLFPSAFAIESGGLVGGTVASLNADDDNYLVVRRPKAGTSAVWTGTFTGVDNAAGSLAVTYRGKASATCTQVVSIFRWPDSTWVQLDTRSVGTSEVLVADLSPPGPVADFVSGTTGAGDVRVRVSCTGSTAFTVSADLLTLVV
jgi:hypothetical protein